MGLTPNYAWPTPELSDPANVPVDLKELADAADATVRAIADAIVPIGTVAMWIAAAPPTRWLLCQGQVNIAAVDYPQLAAVLGQTAGVVNMPNLKGRIPIGLDAAQTEFDALRETGGAKALASTAQLPTHTHSDGTLATPAHGHAHTLGVGAGGDHTHSPAAGGYNFVVANGTVTDASRAAQDIAGFLGPIAQSANDFGANGATTPSGNHVHGLGGAITNAAALDVAGATGAVGQASPAVALPPYMVVNYIIKADK